MRYSIILIVAAFVGCSSISVVKDRFDQSIHVKLEMGANTFEKIDGHIEVEKIEVSRVYKSSIASDIKIFCKFEGYDGEIFEGTAIEINTDGVITKLPVIESRFAKNESSLTTSSTLFTRVGAFTFTDSSRSSVNIIAVEAVVTKELAEAINKSKTLMIRVYTKNIDGVQRNTFEVLSYMFKDLKKFIEFVPESR